MPSSLNKVQLIGNLGVDPDIRYTNDNRAIANLTVATSENWKDKQGQRQSSTEWHRVVVFGGLAEIIEKYLQKGDKVYFEGMLKTRQWTDKEGQERYTTEVVVDSFKGTMVMLGSKSESKAKEQPRNASVEPDFDDDIPF